MTFLRTVFLVTLGALLAGCGADRDIRLRSFNTVAGGPEEFAILPTKPLEAPNNLTDLPPPTPGEANRTDLTPKKDAVVALGGRASALTRTGVPSSESGLVSYVARNGRDQNIRATLAQEDESFRRRQSFLTKIRLFKVDRYYQAYRRETLNGQSTAARWRRSGAPTPTAPPASN